MSWLLIIPGMSESISISPSALEWSRIVSGTGSSQSPSQAPEIETMTAWLGDWDEPVPETMRDHSNAEGEMEMDSDMPGMMSSQDMDELETAVDADFQEMWLEMMLEHHEGAVEMAQTEQDDGEFEPAMELAESIEASQSDEIELMEGQLGS